MGDCGPIRSKPPHPVILAMLRRAVIPFVTSVGFAGATRWPAHCVSSRNLRSFHSAPIALGADSY